MGRRQGRSDPIAKDLSLLSPEVLGTPPAPLPAAKRGGKKKPPPAHRPFSRHGRRDFPASWHLQQRLMHFGRGLVEGTAVVPPPVTAGSPKAALRPTLPLLPQGSAEALQGFGAVWSRHGSIRRGWGTPLRPLTPHSCLKPAFRLIYMRLHQALHILIILISQPIIPGLKAKRCCEN